MKGYRTAHATLALLAAFLTCAVLADDTNKFLIYSPDPTTWGVPYPCSGNACTGDIPNRPALFGITPVENGINGVLMDVSKFTDGTACNSFSYLNNEEYYNDGRNFGSQLVAVVRRGGGCTFATKVKNCENARFSAVIVVNDQAGVAATNLPYMVDDGGGQNVHIPSILIKKEDGDAILLQAAQLYGNEEFILAELLLWIPRPDNRVEVDFFAPSIDSESKVGSNNVTLVGSATQFRLNFGDSFAALGNNVMFYPHTAIYPGSSLCTGVNGNLNCPNQCTNQGKYCYFGPVSSNVLPYQVVQESTRQLVLWRLLNQYSASNNIFKYYAAFYGAGGCGNFTNSPYKPRDYSEDCSSKIINSLNAANAWSSGSNSTNKVDISFAMVKSIIGGYDPTSGNRIPDVDNDIDVLNDLNPITLPFLFVNEAPIYGGVNCPTPITRTTCSVTAAICNGFESTSIPTVCQTSEDCPLGMTKDRCSVCNGTNACLTSSGTSLGVLFAVAVCLSILVGLGIVWYTRKQQSGTRNDIDKLLQQYLPSDAALGTPASKKTLAGMHKARLMSDEDQNVMLDSAEDI